MFNRIIQFAVEKRLIVIAATVILLIAGSLSIVRTPVDVLPDFNRPVVTIFSEAHGLAPEEVETLVTLPIESAVNGATNVVRVRSISGIGLSIVFVEFDWGTDIYANRQVVSERLQRINSRLPAGMTPVLGPISSIMGSISLIAFRSKTGQTPPVEVRTLVDWVVRPRLQAIPGVSQIINLGGGEKEYQVLLWPDQLRQYGLSLQHVQEAISASNQNTSGGYLELGDREYLIRNLGRIRDVEDLKNTAVTREGGGGIHVRNIARVTVGEKVKRGDAGFNAAPAVITNVFMHSGANTIEVTRQLDRALGELRTALPADVEIHSDVFRQADFIQSAVSNIKHSMRDASLLVLLVLPIFLLNFRTTFITMTAIPLSFVMMALVMRLFGFTMNTMTLGGLALAVGEVVDDAIIDVENIYRRLKQNRQSPRPRPALDVIRDASIEVRHSVLYSTYLVILIFIPLLFLTGVEARIFMPLGIAFILSIIASTVVAVVVVPALSAYLLPNAKFLKDQRESVLVRWLKKVETRALNFSLSHTGAVLFFTGTVLLVSLALLPFMGLEFMPPFNEGSFTVNILANPGISLTESNRIGVQAEQLLLKIPEVRSTGRRTGRAELDDHAEPVNYTEIEVALKKSKRSSEEVAQQIRQNLSVIPGVVVAVGQPISHKIDHLLSGVSAQVAVKVFGPDLAVLQETGEKLRQIMTSVRGVVDLQMENQVPIPQVRIQVDRQGAGLYGFQPGEINEVLETYLNGRVISQVLEGQRSYDILLRLDEPYRRDTISLQNLLIDSPQGGKVPLKQLASVQLSEGPNQILRENAQRRIVVQCNVSGRDLGTTVSEIRSRVQKELNLPPGYFILYGGQFESQQEATRTILVTSVFVIIAIFVLLFYRFNSARVAALIMVNLPLAAIGSIIAVFWAGGVLSVASLIGFIAVCSIASRTSLMLLSHYVHMMKYEGEEFGRQLVVRGALERLVPVMMTSSTAALGLIPLVLAKGETGKEVLYPVAVVLLGGLISSTFLVMIVVPALFHKLGKPIWEGIQEERRGANWHQRTSVPEPADVPPPKIVQVGKNA